MEKIIIYTNEACPYCKVVKEEFEKQNVEFEERLTKDHIKKWENIVNLTGLPSVPTVEYNNEYFVPGREFNSPNQLIDILKAWRKPTYSQSKMIFERIKSLNYSISMAFSRTDQLLRQIETKINTDEHKSTD
tara:strand:+ start:148 stop:543 length:396 start_codon:yes stop_codon:yes gene_type:complete